MLLKCEIKDSIIEGVLYLDTSCLSSKVDISEVNFRLIREVLVCVGTIEDYEGRYESDIVYYEDGFVGVRDGIISVGLCCWSLIDCVESIEIVEGEIGKMLL